jgi:hypothetical protein
LAKSILKHALSRKNTSERFDPFFKIAVIPSNTTKSVTYFQACPTRIVGEKLNRKFERRYVWLKDSAQKDGHVKRYYYDTTDCTAPSQIDIVRYRTSIIFAGQRQLSLPVF